MDCRRGRGRSRTRSRSRRREGGSRGRVSLRRRRGGNRDGGGRVYRSRGRSLEDAVVFESGRRWEVRNVRFENAPGCIALDVSSSKNRASSSLQPMNQLASTS